MEKINDSTLRNKKNTRQTVEGFKKSTFGGLPCQKNGLYSPELLQNRYGIVKTHVESFNWVFMEGGGLSVAIEDIDIETLDERIDLGIPGARWWITSAKVDKPMRYGGDSMDKKMFPNECREGHVTYGGMLSVTLEYELSSGERLSLHSKLGNIPIMVMSQKCNLHNMSPKKLIEHKEEASEVGGYFIVNGAERMIRQVIVKIKNTVISLVRASHENYGELYTPYAVYINCCKNDQTTMTNTLMYLKNGVCTLRIFARAQEFFLPALLLLRCFIPCTDRQIFVNLVQGESNNAFLINRVERFLRSGSGGVQSRNPNSILSYFGEKFRHTFKSSIHMSSLDVGKYLLDRYIFSHCETGQEKFDLLIFMIRKVYYLSDGKIKGDNQDGTDNHEIMTAGELYLTYLKERLTNWTKTLKRILEMNIRMKPETVQLDKASYWRDTVKKMPDVGRAMHYFLATGNLKTAELISVPQYSGWTIAAEKLNFYRYLSHFRAVHRGQFFTTMRTTSVRKLRPESWGFLCPVHTPDGAPCGLLNHLSSTAHVVTYPSHIPKENLIQVLCQLGMYPSSFHEHAPLHNHITVFLDGIVVGRVPSHFVRDFTNQLRYLKVTGHQHVLSTLQIDVVMNFDDKLFPVVSLTTRPGRLIRPVEYIMPESQLRDDIFSILKDGPYDLHSLPKKKIRLLVEKKKGLKIGALKAKRNIISEFIDQYFATKGKQEPFIEWIGPKEQVFMEISCIPSDFRPGITTHRELDPMNIISLVASLTPFSDFNQSPRNMYQCQMGKQTMATPFHSFPHRTDTKFYRLGTPQKPLVSNANQEKYYIDDYPMGTNACVAVISHTGYDMEDAMIINKGAYDRGFKHGTVYKNYFVDLAENRSEGMTHFSNEYESHNFGDNFGEEKILKCPELDMLGLPPIGQLVKKHDPLYCTYNDATKRLRIKGHKENETCMIDEIRLIGNATDKELQKINIKVRFNRNPVIGDKFSSRHGQKGVLSVLWPQEDMPFTESGMTPDIIINPHAFPSRMTIGMLIESMAGKAACLHGIHQDSTPFRFHDDDPAVDYFGKQLARAGYNYYGTEPMYSGISGQELRCEIFYGLVYYQRLRHMINDKSQVRATGPVDFATRQPVKGRKRHGGIRFGEMERDSLISHGTAFLLYDRLLMCSDFHKTTVCVTCGSLLSTHGGAQKKPGWCRQCKTGSGCTKVIIPYVFMYLTNELAAMNIKLTLQVK